MTAMSLALSILTTPRTRKACVHLLTKKAKVWAKDPRRDGTWQEQLRAAIERQAFIPVGTSGKLRTPNAAEVRTICRALGI